MSIFKVFFINVGSSHTKMALGKKRKQKDTRKVKYRSVLPCDVQYSIVAMF